MMLQACYRTVHEFDAWLPAFARGTEPVEKLVKAAVLSISVYCVADKYDALDIRHYTAYAAASLLGIALSHFEKNSSNPQLPSMIIGFGDILKKTYEVTGHRNSEDRLRTMILDTIMGDRATQPFGSAEFGPLVPEVVRLAAAIPDFGSDMFLRLVGRAVISVVPRKH